MVTSGEARKNLARSGTAAAVQRAATKRKARVVAPVLRASGLVLELVLKQIRTDDWIQLIFSIFSEF